MLVSLFDWHIVPSDDKVGKLRKQPAATLKQPA